MSDWLAMLRTAVEREGSIAEVGRQLGVSRPLISRVLSGTYDADTANLAAKVTDRFGRVTCPHLDEEISRAACLGYLDRPYPTSSATQAAHWRACRSGCPHSSIEVKK